MNPPQSTKFSNEVKASLTWHKIIWDHANRWLKYADDTIKGKVQRKQKPVLICGSKFMKYQDPTDCVRDKPGGKCVKKNGKEVLINDQFAAQIKGGDSIFEIATPYFNQYATMSDPEYANLPKDQDGDQHFCRGSFGQSTTIWLPKGKELVPVVILCTSTIMGSTRGLEEPDMSEQPVTKNIDSMAVRSLSLYQELFKLQGGPDSKEMAYDKPVRYGLTTTGQLENGFPGRLEAWAKRGTEDKPVYASTGTDSLWMTMYDQAVDKTGKPKATRVENLQSLNCPSTYAWFGLVSLMSSQTKQIWGTGLAQPADSPWQPVYAKGRNAPGSKYIQAALETNSDCWCADADDGLACKFVQDGEQSLPLRPANEVVAGPSGDKGKRPAFAPAAGGRGKESELATIKSGRPKTKEGNSKGSKSKDGKKDKKKGGDADDSGSGAGLAGQV